jgi:hypothetical protein
MDMGISMDKRKKKEFIQKFSNDGDAIIRRLKAITVGHLEGQRTKAQTQNTNDKVIDKFLISPDEGKSFPTKILYLLSRETYGRIQTPRSC